MQNLISLKTKGLARHLGFPTRLNGLNCSTLQRGLVFLVTMILLVGTIAAQNNKETKQARRLMTEGQRLVDEGSEASFRKAIEKFETVRILAHSLNEIVLEADMLSAIGILYLQLEQYQKAIEKFEQSLPLWRAAGDRKQEARSLKELGLIQNVLGERQKALDNLSQAVLLSRAAGDRDAEAQALVLIGSIHCGLGKCEESLPYLNKALELCRHRFS